MFHKFCKSDSDSANKIVSSAHSNTNTSIDILKFVRHFCDTVWRPVMLLLHKLSSISEGNTADKKGDKFYPFTQYSMSRTLMSHSLI